MVARFGSKTVWRLSLGVGLAVFVILAGFFLNKDNRILLPISEANPDYPALVVFDEPYWACAFFPYEDCGRFCSVPEAEILITIEVQSGAAEEAKDGDFERKYRYLSYASWNETSFAVGGNQHCVLKKANEPTRLEIEPISSYQAKLTLR